MTNNELESKILDFLDLITPNIDEALEKANRLESKVKNMEEICKRVLVLLEAIQSLLVIDKNIGNTQKGKLL